MSFNIQCNNKGCFEITAATISKEDNQVYCLNCDNPIANITDFTKRQLLMSGQVKKKSKKGEGFAVKCESCNGVGMPLISDENSYIFHCKHCNSEMKNISEPFKNLIRQKQTKMP